MNASRPGQLAPAKLHRELLKALHALRAKPCDSTVHHSNANQHLRWDEIQQRAFAVRFGGQVFQLQLLLERHLDTGLQRVVMFCRRTTPPSSALSKNTQRGTFNSTNRDAAGFYMQPQLPKGAAQYHRAFTALLPAGNGFPFWNGRRIEIGDSSAPVLLKNFLKATAVIEEIKGQSASELASRYPASPSFTAQDIRAAGEVSEGRKLTVNRQVRERALWLRQFAADRYRQQSPDGRLRCIVDGWAPTVPVRGDIVEIHHDDALEGFPDAGRTMTVEEAVRFLFPLCPNCHRLLHARPGGGRYAVPELLRLMQRRQKQKEN